MKKGFKRLSRVVRFWEKITRAEALLVRVVVLGILVLTAAQLASGLDPIEREFQLSKLLEEPAVDAAVQQSPGGGPASERESLDVPAAEPLALEHQGSDGVITLRLVDFFSAAGIKILVNGVVKADFLRQTVSIPVRKGDQLALDVRNFQPGIRVEVFDVSPGIAAPAEGAVIVATERITQLEQVEIP